MLHQIAPGDRDKGDSSERSHLTFRRDPHLAFVLPTAAGAAGSSCRASSCKAASRHGVSRQHILNANLGHRQQPNSSGTALKLGTYDAWAYVNGGASQKVAMAIASAGKQRPTIGPSNASAYVYGGASQEVAKAITTAGKQAYAA